MSSVKDMILGRDSRRRPRSGGGSRSDSPRNRYVEREAGPEAICDGFRVLNVTLIQTGTYNPEFFRPYSTSLSRRDVDEIETTMDDNGRRDLIADDLSGMVGRIMRMKSSVSDDDLVDIEEGWDSPRLSFMIEVAEERYNEFSERSMEEIVTTISGYTNTIDLVETPRSPYGDVAPAPDMEFFVTAMHRETRETRRIAANDQIISPAYYRKYNGERRNLYTLRPKDVFNTEVARENTPIGARPVMAANHIAGNSPKASRNSNLLPSYYMASSINAILAGEKQSSGVIDRFGVPMGESRRERSSVYSKAASVAEETAPLAHNSFLYLLKVRTERYSSTNTFFWEDLEELFGREILRTTRYYKNSETVRDSGRVSHAGDCADWDDNTNGGYNAILATAIKQAAPGIALMYGIYSCRIDATNIDVYGEDDVIAGSLINVDNVIFTSKLRTLEEEYQRIDNFRDQIARHVLRGASMDNEVSYDVHVELDWRGDTFIDVGIDGGEMIEFSTASYTNSLTSPIITNNQDVTRDIATDFQTIVSKIMG